MHAKTLSRLLSPPEHRNSIPLLGLIALLILSSALGYALHPVPAAARVSSPSEGQMGWGAPRTSALSEFSYAEGGIFSGNGYRIAFDPVSQEFFSVTHTDSLVAISESDWKPLGQINLTSGPGADLALDPIHQVLFVAGGNSTGLTEINTTTLKVVRTVPTATDLGVAVDPAREIVAYGNGSFVSVVNYQTWTPIASVSMVYPLSLAIDSGDGIIGVTYQNTSLGLLNETTGRWISNATGAPDANSILYDPISGDFLFGNSISGGQLSLVPARNPAGVVNLTVPSGTKVSALAMVGGSVDEALLWEYDTTAGGWMLLPFDMANHTFLPPAASQASGYPAGIAVDPFTHVALASDPVDGEYIPFYPLLPAANPWQVYATLLLENDSVVPGNYVPPYTTSIEPHDLFFDPYTGEVYVSERAIGRVAVIDPASGQAVANISVGINPEGFALDPFTHELLVANTGYLSNDSNIISIVNTTLNRVVGNITVGWKPWEMAYDPLNGLLYATDAGSNNVTIVNLTTDRAIGNISVGNVPYGITYDSSNHDIYVADDGGGAVSVIDPSTARVIATVPTGGNPGALAYDPANAEIYVPEWNVSYVDVINGTTNTVVETLPTGSLPQGALAVAPDTVFLSDSNSPGDLTILNGSLNFLQGTLAVGDHPSGMAYVPTCKCVYAANLFSDSISMLSPTSSPPPLLTHLTFTTSNTGTSPLNVTMKASSVGGVAPYTYSWNYGDGSTGSGALVAHTFRYTSGCGSATNCTFVVTLTGKDARGSQSVATGNVIVANPNSTPGKFGVAIAFTTPTVGYAPLTVTMDAQVSNASQPVSYHWTLGDGTTASGYSSVTHIYQAPVSGCGSAGCTYAIMLSATDAAGQTATASGQVTVLTSNQSVLTVTMGASPATGVAPLTVAFSGSASGGTAPYSYTWTFGDSTTGSGATVSHLYAISGTYSVVLTTVDAKGAVAQTSSNIVVYPTPAGNQTGGIEVSLSATPLTGPAPLSPQFTASATGGTAPYSYAWNFGDNSTNATGASVAHTYTHAGEFVVTLAVTDSAGNVAETGVIVDVTGGNASNSPLKVLVSMYNMHGAAPLPVTFTPLVVGGTAPYLLTWNFGDGTVVTTHSLAPVTHTYRTPGTYDPELMVIDTSGNSVLWSSQTSAPSHPEVSVAAKSPASTTFPWLYLALVAIAAGLVIIVVVMLVQGKKRKLAGMGGDPLASPGPYQRYHAIPPPSASGQTRRGGGPSAPVPPAPSDPLGDSL